MNPSHPPLRGPARHVAAALAALLPLGLLPFAACSRAASAPASPGLPTLQAGTVQLFEFAEGGEGEAPVLRPARASALTPASRRKPWTDAIAATALDVVDGRIAVAVNGAGLGFLERSGRGRLSWDFAGGPAFPGRSILSAWSSSGRFWAFLARNEAFDGDGAQDADPSPFLVSRAPGETSCRESPLPWDGGGWVTGFLAPESGRGGLLAQQSRPEGGGASFRYLRISPDGASWKEIGSDSYLAAFEPLPASAADETLKSICDPQAALGRYSSMPGYDPRDSAVIIDERLPGSGERSFLLAGTEDAGWMATLSAWAYGGEAAALTADGQLRFAGRGVPPDGKLPALPASFDYGKVAGDGKGMWAVAWSETVFPETGRAGIAVLQAPRN